MTFSEIMKLNFKCSVKTLSYVDMGQGIDRGSQKRELISRISQTRAAVPCPREGATRETAPQLRHRLPAPSQRRAGTQQATPQLGNSNTI